MKEILKKHLERYPRMQVQDAVKLLYQSEFGGGHMISDPEESLTRLRGEWASAGTGCHEKERAFVGAGCHAEEKAPVKANCHVEEEASAGTGCCAEEEASAGAGCHAEEKAPVKANCRVEEWASAGTGCCAEEEASVGTGCHAEEERQPAGSAAVRPPARCHSIRETYSEEIGGGLCRVSLSVMNEGMAPETLNRIFVLTAEQKTGTVSGFERKLDILRQCCGRGELPFSLAELDGYLAGYRARGYPAVSHSEVYRQAYHPAYRVVSDCYARYLQAYAAIDRMAAEKVGKDGLGPARGREKTGKDSGGPACGGEEVGKDGRGLSCSGGKSGKDGRESARGGEESGKTCVVAIDGMCGSGKSTMGRILREVYGCRLFRMDDFFLRPEQRTRQRYAQPGGNVDYERFREEVLDHMGDRDGLWYQPFDCATLTLRPAVGAGWSFLNIVEGSYSQHPYFGDAYDLRFFCQISAEEQRRRILGRNGPEMWEKFEKLWIPMENRYFEIFGIREKSIPVWGQS